MAELLCAARNPGCQKTAIYVCHHCGRALCSRCDREMVDHQFAKLAGPKKEYPKAHHCPSCYHADSALFTLKKRPLSWLRQLFRQILS